jgi:predicted transcriptional regulator
MDIETVFDQVRGWDKQRQQDFAALVVALEALGKEPYVLSDEERAAVERGRDDVRNGRFASDAEMKALFDRYR